MKEVKFSHDLFKARLERKLVKKGLPGEIRRVIKSINDIVPIYGNF